MFGLKLVRLGQVTIRIKVMSKATIRVRFRLGLELGLGLGLGLVLHEEPAVVEPAESLVSVL